MEEIKALTKQIVEELDKRVELLKEINGRLREARDHLEEAVETAQKIKMNLYEKYLDIPTYLRRK